MNLMILENRRLVSTVRAGTGQVSIGSSPQCNVHLADPRIVPHIANLNQDETGEWWLEVVDTSLPTCLNRAVTKGRAKLRHADEITVAHYCIRMFMEVAMSREEAQRERMQALSKAHEGSLALDSIIQKSSDAVQVSKDHLEQITLLVQRLIGAENSGQLMLPILRAVLRTLDGRRAWIGIRRADRGPLEWSMGLTDKGQPCDRPAFAESMEARCLDHSQYICSPESPQTGVRSAMGVPLACQSGNLGFLYVENDAADSPFDRAALQTFSAMACCVARPVENFVLQTASRRKAVAGSELTISRITQDALTPKALPHWEDLQIAAYRHMGSAACCDFYDIVQLADKTACMVVARLDVEAMHTPRYLTEVRAAFRSAALHNDAPHLFARALNWAIFSGDGRNSIHLAALWLAPKSGRAQFVIAGQRALIRRISEDGECLPAESPDAPPVGRSKAPSYDARALELAGGDSLLIATTGAEAVTNAAGEAFGFSRLEESVCDGAGQPPGSVLSDVEADLQEFMSGGGACPEDVTLLFARRP